MKKLAPEPPEQPAGPKAKAPETPAPAELSAMLLKTALDVAHRTTRVPGSSTSLIVALDEV